jgi:group I intron endonuclease
MTMRSGIYRIINTVNGKFYVGSAVDLDQRWARHRFDLMGGVHHNIHLQRAWLKHGEASFKFEVVEVVESGNLFEREQVYLDATRCYDALVGYNIGRHACGGDNLTSNPRRSEIIEKMAAGSKRRWATWTQERRRQYIEGVSGTNNPNYGKRWSETQRQRMSIQRSGMFLPHMADNFAKGRLWMRENRDVVAARVSGKGNPFFEKSHSSDVKAVLSEKAKARIAVKRNSGNSLASNSIPIIIDGVKYLSAAEASAALRCNRQTILNRARNPNFPNYLVDMPVAV